MERYGAKHTEQIFCEEWGMGTSKHYKVNFCVIWIKKYLFGLYYLKDYEN